jgi:hypothetical protein
MRHWTWVLPCWVWKYFFAQLPRERVLVDGRHRFLIRLDEEFALVYDPQGQAILQTSSEATQHRHVGHPSFRNFEKPSLSPGQGGGNKFLRAFGLRDDVGVGTQAD